MASKSIVIKLNDIKKENVIFAPLDLKEASSVVENHYQNMYKPKNLLEYEVGETNYRLVDVKNEFKNAFICAALTAYNNHVPLELSPDDIWAEIALGIAQHLGGDPDLAETYRKVFVSHEGKKELAVRVESLGITPKDPKANKGAWPQVVQMLCDKIKENTKTNVADTMRAPFSTSGPVERTVFHCLLMETMKNYFEYKAMCMCGIPEVTIHGTIQDWQNIIERVNEMKSVFADFHWYLDRVNEIVSKIVVSVQGKPDLHWWNTMIFEEEFGSGGERGLSGWLCHFTPYIMRSNGERDRNHGNSDFDDLNAPAVTLTDFKLDYYGKEYKMKIASGFLGVSQNKETLAVRPALGWMTYYME